MAGSSKDSDDSHRFQDVFTEGPLEELTTRCDIITTASLIGSSKLHLDSTRYNATLHSSQPFGLPCVLHSHPGGCNKYIKGEGTMCKLTPLDRFSSDAMLPNCLGSIILWAGANGDWIATIGHESNWKLVNVYTHHQVPLPPVRLFQATHDPFVYLHNGRHIFLRKIAICQFPTADAEYLDYRLVAIFGYGTAILGVGGAIFEWTVLQNHFQRFFTYSDAIIHQGVVFAVNEYGNVYAWDNPLYFGPVDLHHGKNHDDNPGPSRLLKSPGELVGLFDEYDVRNGDCGTWWLACSLDGSRLLLVYTRGTVDHYGAIADHNVVHYGGHVRTYASGFPCRVFSMDTSQLAAEPLEEIADDTIVHYGGTIASGFSYMVLDTSRLCPSNRWEIVTNMGDYSLLLGVNHPIFMPVGGADVAPGYLTRSNHVYTSDQEIGYKFSPRLEFFRFYLNGEQEVVCFSIDNDSACFETVIWFIPSFANALNWNRLVYM